jgi:hypothetical protein
LFVTPKLTRRDAVDAFERSREVRCVGEPKSGRDLVERVTGLEKQNRLRLSCER